MQSQENRIAPRTLIEKEIETATHHSLIAMRRGDYDKVAKLTLKLIQLKDLNSERKGGELANAS